MEEPYRSGSRGKPNIFDCPESFAKWYCLNGATCFMVKAQNTSLYNCWCKDGFHGVRCDQKFVSRLPEALYSIGSSDERRSHFTFIKTVDTISESLMHGHEAMTKQVDEEPPLVNYYASMVLILLLLLFMLLIFCRWQKRKQIHSAMNEPRTDLVALNNEVINQDRIAAELALIERLNHLRRQLPSSQLKPAVSQER